MYSVRSLICFLCLVVVFAFGSAAASESPPVCSESMPVHVSLAVDSVPLVGKEGAVTVTVSVDYDLPDVTLEIQLPTEGKVLDAPVIALGKMSSLAPATRSIRVKFSTPGDKFVRAIVKATERPGVVWSAVEYLPLNIGSAQSSMGLEGTTALPAASQRTPGTGTIVGPAPSVMVQSAAAPPQITASTDHSATPAPQGAVTLGMLTVSGRWSFDDRAGTYATQKDTCVELFRGGDNAHLAWAWTNWNGDYTFPAVTNPGAVGVYVQASTWTDYGSGNFLSIISLGGDQWNNRYRVNSGTIAFADGNQNMGDWFWNDKSIWIHDDYTKAYWIPPDHTGRHVAEWSSTSTHGTHYHPGGNIHLMAGDADDTPDTVLHEMGHSVMYNIYGGYMPPFPNCNPHYLMGSSSTGCGWTEGWAQTWHCWATGNAIRSYPGGGAIDLEAATWGDGYNEGETVEGRVAGAIWDITDSTNEGTDTYTGSWNDVWDVMWNVNCDTFAQFWAQWKARGHAKHGPVACIYQSTIDYNTWPTFGSLPSVTINEDSPLNNAIDLWVYASDPESYDSELAYTITGNTNANCGVSIDAGDYVDINPVANWNGYSDVTIMCSDGIRSRYDTFRITVNAVADPPLISGLLDKMLLEGSVINNATDLWAYTFDPETADSGLTFNIVGNTNSGCGVSIDTNRYIDIYPAANWNGYSDVTIRATDPGGLWTQDTFRITVGAVNDPPVIVPLPNYMMDEDQVWDPVFDLWAVASDVETPDADLNFAITGNTNTNCGASISSGHYMAFHPVSNWNGYSDVTLRVTDTGGLWDEVTLRITVSPVNDTPVMSALPFVMVYQNQPRNNVFDLWLMASDIETGDADLTFTITGDTSPSCGVSIDSNQYIDVKPALNWTGSSMVTVRVTDTSGAWDEKTFEIVVGEYVATIQEARNRPDGSWIILQYRPVTASFSSFFYIEENPSRTAGIRVSYSSPPAVNKRVATVGQMGTYYAERVINAHWVSIHFLDEKNPPRPLGMINGTLGGSSPNKYTVAVPLEGKGLYNVGLLARTTGEVKGFGTRGRYYIADGSPVIDSRISDPWLLVDAIPSGWYPPVGVNVSITGISGASTLSFNPIRMFRPRDDNDITINRLKAVYIYDRDSKAASLFKIMLDPEGIQTTLLTAGNIGKFDFTGYHVVIVASDTFSIWKEYPAGVGAIVESGLPIVAIGAGGGTFLDAVTKPDLFMGWGQSWTGSSQTMGIVVGGDIYSSPYTIPNSPGDKLSLYNDPGVTMQSLYDPENVVTHMLGEYGDKAHYPVAREASRFYMWGYIGTPSTMTEEGHNLFVNLIFNTLKP